MAFMAPAMSLVTFAVRSVGVCSGACLCSAACDASVDFFMGVSFIEERFLWGLEAVTRTLSHLPEYPAWMKRFARLRQSWMR